MSIGVIGTVWDQKISHKKLMKFTFLYYLFTTIQR